VTANPTADLISRERSVEVRSVEVRSVEVRRCAIERIGWDDYLAPANLRVIAACADPGNPGAQLGLADLPPAGSDPVTRILLVTNGTQERDGRRRRYGPQVPAEIDDPLTAACAVPPAATPTRSSPLPVPAGGPPTSPTGPAWRSAPSPSWHPPT
jgi:hypothetical protein